jgi:3-oxoadipate enol-lactonase
MPTPLLHYTEHGSGPPLVLVHGVMITGEMFAPVIESLAARHRLIVPDLRGHGRSRHLPPPYTVSQLAADVAHLLDHLEIESAAVLGYSQGGAIAQQVALDYPRRCTRLVLACTYAYNMATMRETIEGHVAPWLVRVLGMSRFARLVIAQGLKGVEKTRADWVVGLIADQDPSLMIAAWRAAMAFDSRQRLGEISCPTLVVAGADDHAVPFHHAKRLHDGIRGSRLIVIDRADHALIWMRPDELARVVGEFLDA